ncbi:hypothetical protein [Streptomyces sp. KMM 9044]|uniref:hypothetical protein n=1 Tax=Streptomyces sp. KMM 9044 TaxID=2744474 RepID=UPI002150BB2E|nr:hypothetical protein [Streptomyces sp. KMM 9044]WAX81240.1 hypothetical protein HUV60_029900 [Streptomyces sp. KMM 9044]
MPAHLEQPVGCPQLRAVPARNCAAALTRRLHPDRGMTADLPEHHHGHPLRLQVPPRTPASLRIGGHRLLHPTPAPPWLIRTEPAAPEGTVVPRTVVIGRLPRNDGPLAAVTSRLVPPGRSVAASGVPHRRTQPTARRSERPGRRGVLPAVAGSHLLPPDGEFPLHVAEAFNPVGVSPGQGPGSAPAVGRRRLRTAS